METIDIEVWFKTVFIPRRKREVELGKQLFGYKLMGWCYVDSWYGIMKSPDDPYVTDHPYQVQPVYLKDCECERLDKHYLENGNPLVAAELEKEKIFGHHDSCLEEFPKFSTDADAMLLLMNKLGEYGETTLTRYNNKWCACLNNHCDLRPEGYGEDAPAAVFALAMEWLEIMQKKGRLELK